MSDNQKRKDHRVGMQSSGWQQSGRATVEQVRLPSGTPCMYVEVVCRAVSDMPGIVHFKTAKLGQAL